MGSTLLNTGEVKQVGGVQEDLRCYHRNKHRTWCVHDLGTEGNNYQGQVRAIWSLKDCILGVYALAVYGLGAESSRMDLQFWV